MFELVPDKSLSENDRLWMLVLAAREARRKTQQVEVDAIDAWQRHIQKMIDDGHTAHHFDCRCEACVMSFTMPNTRSSLRSSIGFCKCPSCSVQGLQGART